MFGSDYGLLFGAANKRAATGRERHTGPQRSPNTPANPPRPSTGFQMAQPLNSPKNISSKADKLIMDELRRKPPQPPFLTSALEAALDRWKLAFEKAKAIG